MFTRNLGTALAGALIVGAIATASIGGAALADAGSATRHPIASPGSSSTGVNGDGVGSGHSDSGDFSDPSGAFTARGIHTRHGRGYADASVDDLSIGGRSLGSVDVTCRQGVTQVIHHGGVGSSRFLHVSYGTGGRSSTTGLVATITDARGRVSQTVRAATVSCEQVASNPTQHPTRPPRHHTTKPTIRHDRDSSEQAPAPVPAPGHAVVTG